MNVTVKLEATSQTLQKLGLGADGDVRRFYTQTVQRRIMKYLPYRTYGSVPKAVVRGVDLRLQRIVIEGAHIRYLNEGKVMVGRKPKTATSKNLVYTTTYNRQAGPHWAQRLDQYEHDMLVQEVQNYVNRRK